MNLYYKPAITWNAISSGKLSCRSYEEGFLFEHAAASLFVEKGYSRKYFLAYINSTIFDYIFTILNPTLNNGAEVVSTVPVKYNSNEIIEDLVQQNITISRQDWDSHETSWDFEQNPLVALAQRVGGAVSHRTTGGNDSLNDLQGSGETPLLLKQEVGGAVSHRTTGGNDSLNDLQGSGGTPLLLKQEVGGAVSHRTTGGNDSLNDLQGSGGTPLLLRRHFLKFVNKREYIDITGSKLPHWNQTGCVQFVTFRLADSLPQAKLMEYRQMREKWLAAHPKPWDGITQEEYDHTIGDKIDKWLEAGYGSCLLQDEQVRRIVEDSILHYDGERYVIHAYVIMPNHVHVLLTPGDGNAVQDIVGGWKKYTAHELNKLLDRNGAVWERESFDRMVRSSEDFDAKLNYIAENPLCLPQSSYTLNIGGAVSHRTIGGNDSLNNLQGSGETPLLLKQAVGGAVSHRTNEELGADAGGTVSHCATEGINSSNESQWCGETPHLLMADLVAQYEEEWTEKFMLLHANEEELNRQFISIYGLEDELSPDVPLSEITILQQGEVTIEEDF